jgi:hypothetical protein
MLDPDQKLSNEHQHAVFVAKKWIALIDRMNQAEKTMLPRSWLDHA